MMSIKKLSSVSFFCPAYHDEKNLPVLIPHVIQFLQEITDTYQITIVHDGSPDKTGEAAERLASAFPHVRVIHHPYNMGYGDTLRDGFKTSTYDYVAYTDGDNQYDVREFLPYIHLLDEADVISGYVKEKSSSFRRKMQSQIYNWLIRILFCVWYRDINCSMKIYKRHVLESITIQSPSAYIDAEMLIKTHRAGFKIAQFPVTHFPRNEGTASGSKLSVVATTIRDMLKHRLGLL